MASPKAGRRGVECRLETAALPSVRFSQTPRFTEVRPEQCSARATTAASARSRQPTKFAEGASATRETERGLLVLKLELALFYIDI